MVSKWHFFMTIKLVVAINAIISLKGIKSPRINKDTRDVRKSIKICQFGTYYNYYCVQFDLTMIFLDLTIVFFFGSGLWSCNIQICQDYEMSLAFSLTSEIRIWFSSMRSFSCWCVLLILILGDVVNNKLLIYFPKLIS